MQATNHIAEWKADIGKAGVNVSDCDPDSRFYLMAYDKNGVHINTEILELQVKYSVLKGKRTIKFANGQKLSITVPSDTPIVGGMKVQFDMDKLSYACDVNCTDAGYEIILGGTREIWLIADKVSLQVTAQGSLFEDYGSNTVSGKIYLEFAATGEWEQQLMAGPVPVVVAVEVTGSVGAEGSVTISLDSDSLENVKLAMKIALGLGVDLYAGVGFAEIVSVGVYGNAKFTTIFLVTKEEGLLPEKIAIEGDAGLRAKMFCFQQDVKLIKGEWIICENNWDYLDSQKKGSPEAVGMSMEEVSEKLSDLASYYIAERGDTSQRTEWLGNSITADENVIQMLQGATYKGEAPQIATAGDTTILFYNNDDLTQSVANGSKLAYSVYENGVFKTPVNLSAADKAQYGFDVYEGEDGIYVIWQEAKEVLEDTTSLQDTADALELKAAKFDAATQSFTMLGTITDNEIYESNPEICAVDGQIYATWIENSEDNIFGDSGTNTVKKAVYNGGSWSESVLTEGLSKVTNTDAGAIGDAPYMAYVADGSVTAVDLTGGQRTVVGASQNAQFGYVGGKSALVWDENGAVKAAEAIDNITTLFDDVALSSNGYKYISNASGNSSIIYSAVKDGKAQAYMADYDVNTKQWGNVQAITDQSDYIENISGAYSGSEVITVFNKTRASVTEGDIFASTDLCCMKVGKAPALNIEYVAHHASEAVPGGKVNLEIGVKNTGLSTAKAEDIAIVLTNENGKEVLVTKAEKDVRAGTTEAQNVVVTLPYTLSASTYTVKVTCGNSTDTEEVVFGASDLTVSAKVYVHEDTREVEATVENIGIEPAAGKMIFINRANDEVLAERTFEELDYSETATETYVIPQELYSGAQACSIMVKVETDANQTFTDNDVAYVYLPKRQGGKPCRVIFDYANSAYENVRTYVEEGNSPVFPEAPDVEGYEFLGWYNGDVKVTEDVKVTGNMKLTAKYEKIPEPETPSGKPSDNPTDKPSDKPSDPSAGKPTSKPSVATKAVPKKNSKKTINDITYKVTKSDAKKGTVEVTKVKAKKTKVTIPKTVKISGYTFKVTSIGKNAFKNNKKVKKITVGDNVKTIGSNAFYGCKKLTTVTIGKSVTSIGSKAFYNCKSLKTITINSGKLKKVGKNALKGIHKKATIKVPSKKQKAYKKLFKKKGQKSTVQIKKK